MELAMGIDVGTSGVKVVVSDWEIGLLASASRRYEVQVPEHAYAEQNPTDWLMATIEAIQDLDRHLLQQVTAICFTGQMHAVLAVDERFRPLTNAILWFDARAAKQAAELTATLQQRQDPSHARLVVDPTLPLAKIRWLRDNGNLEWTQVRLVMGAKDWLRCQFGGSAQTDASEASGTQLFNPITRDWDPYLVTLAGLDLAQLPLITDSIAEDGRLNSRMARQTGLPEGCPLYVGGGDFPTAMALFDLQPEDLVINIGTSGQVAMRSAAPTSQAGLPAFASVRSPDWLTLVPLLSVGMSLAWWNNILAASSNGLAGAITSGTGATGTLKAPSRPIFLPQIAGERPWHAHRLSTGGFFSLRSEHGVADLSMAVREGVAMSIREACEALLGDPLKPRGRVYLTGTPGFTDLMAGEISAALGQPLHVQRFTEPTAEAATYLAFLGSGHGQRAPRHWASEATVVPSANQINYYESIYSLYQKTRLLQSQLFAL